LTEAFDAFVASFARGIGAQLRAFELFARCFAVGNLNKFAKKRLQTALQCFDAEQREAWDRVREKHRTDGADFRAYVGDLVGVLLCCLLLMPDDRKRNKAFDAIRNKACAPYVASMLDNTGSDVLSNAVHGCLVRTSMSLDEMKHTYGHLRVVVKSGPSSSLFHDVQVCHAAECFVRGPPVGLPLRLCSACRIACYCSQTCQREDWKRHKAVCKK